MSLIDPTKMGYYELLFNTGLILSDDLKKEIVTPTKRKEHKVEKIKEVGEYRRFSPNEDIGRSIDIYV